MCETAEIKNRGCAGIKRMCETAKIKNRGCAGIKRMEETAEIKNRGCVGIKRMEVQEGNKHKINITHRDTKVYETKTGVHIVRVKSNPINKKKKKP